MKNKKLRFAILSLIAFILVTFGLTYAYWIYSKAQNDPNVVGAACLDIAITNESGAISLANQFPISDEEGMESNPYTFTVTNNCNTSVDYQIALEVLGDEDSSMKTSSMKVALNDNISLLSNVNELEPTIDDAYESRALGNARLSAKGTEGSSDEYSLRIWIHEYAPVSENNKTFTSKITVSAGEQIVSSYEKGALAYRILSNVGGEELTSEIDASTGAFGNVTTASEAGLYKTQDDLGDSYYFRGAVTNNYVQFGSYAANSTVNGTTYAEETPMYWRIIRINGDGTIRLVYDGTTKAENGTAHTSVIGVSAYNSLCTEIGLGYTYDDGTGIQVDSTIKGALDTWYDTHLKANYGDKIADSIFCNDRSDMSYAYYDENYNKTDDTNAPHYSVSFGTTGRLGLNKTPSLKCKNKSDRYTMNDRANGNGFLSNPVGLITADEEVFAGNSSAKTNTSYYLYGDSYYTMTPYGKDPDGYCYSYVYKIESGRLYQTSMGESVSDTLGVRPVINLKADVEFTGTGTIDDPYVIEIE